MKVSFNPTNKKIMALPESDESLELLELLDDEDDDDSDSCASCSACCCFKTAFVLFFRWSLSWSLKHNVIDLFIYFTLEKRYSWCPLY